MSALNDHKSICARGHASRLGYALLANRAALNATTEPSAEHIVEISTPYGLHQAGHTAQPARMPSP